MEAKVDVRKLQILNDRINQTIDALNQVRLSVHGLGHAGGLQPQFNPYMTQGYGMGSPSLGFQGYGQGIQGGVPGYGQGLQGGFPGFGQHSPFGFQHSPFQQFANPYLSQGLISPWSQIGSPWSALGQMGQPGLGGIGGGFGGGGFGGLGGGLSQIYGGIGGGLGHTSPDLIERQLAEARANDPFRITQTFPFVVS